MTINYLYAFLHICMLAYLWKNDGTVLDKLWLWQIKLWHPQVNLLSYGLIIKMVVLHLSSTLSRQWHRQLGVAMVVRALSAFGMFRVADVVIPSLTIEGQCRVLPSHGMIASSSLLVSTITSVHHAIIISFSDRKHFNKIQINVSMTVNEVTLLLLNTDF